MIKRILLLLSFALILGTHLSMGQTKKLSALKAKHSKIQKGISESEKILKSTKRDVKSQLANLAKISGDIDRQSQYVSVIQADVDVLSHDIQTKQGRIDDLQRVIADKKMRYEALMKHVYRRRSIQDKLLFIFSAKSMTQIYRRMRYVSEYSKYLRVQAEEIERKQNELASEKSELVSQKNMKAELLQKEVEEKQKLESKKREHQKVVYGLQRKEKQIALSLAAQRKQAASLNKEIDRLVAAEIAAAKKRAEEKRKAEARRRAEAVERENQRRIAEAKAAEERAKARERASASKSESERAAAAKELANAKAATKAAEKKASDDARVQKMEAYKMDNSDALIAGNLERNKGRLPIPITGGYVIVGHYGQYSVAGLKNVRLDNKGIDIRGRAGAKARSVFSGEVSAVFQYGGVSNVLVRHGSYISVYCNLSSVSVFKGKKVNARDVLGTVANDGDGNYVLHFQLRRETVKLNPEQWLAR